MRKIWENGIILFAVFGFWGMIYPDLCFTRDVCIPMEIAEEADMDLFSAICQASYGQIRISSKLYDAISDQLVESKGQNNVKYQQGYDCE